MMLPRNLSSKTMNWHYEENGQARGPVGDAEFEGLIRSGHIRPETRVWNATLSNWELLKNVPRASAPTSSAPENPNSPAGSACVSCGGLFLSDQLAVFGQNLVCASCKPAYVQRLHEGVPDGQTPEYAGFLIRFAAFFLDNLLISLPVFLILIWAVVTGFIEANPTRGLIFQLLLQGTFWIIALLYHGILVGKYGATLGKKACGLKVVNPDGSPVSMGRSFGRAGAQFVSGLICNLGYLVAAFDKEKRALHDMMATTRVIRIRS